MKRKHICFESIDCKYLQYIEASNSWVCLDKFFDLSTHEVCQYCRFAKLRVVEDTLRKEEMHV